MKSTRRKFIRNVAVAGTALSVPWVGFPSEVRAQRPRKNNDLKLAAIGVGGQGSYDSQRAARHARLVAVCDVDQSRMAEFNARFDNKLQKYEDYRQLLDKVRPDVVTIGTPDHWHVPIAIAALRSGCDVYCEKPLTLTIQEGELIATVVRETGRTFQVGTQQRSEFGLLFLKAIAIVKSGRLGKKVNADIAVGGGPTGGPFSHVSPPGGLQWDMWVGPANPARFSPERFDGFRWYYDYSGGKITDWGAHHVDIAQWALGHERSGPVKVSLAGPTAFTPIVPEAFDWSAYFDGRLELPDGFQTATEFHVRLHYADGSTITVHNEYSSEDGKTRFSNGILFTGEEGRIFVDRDGLSGKPVEDMSPDDRGAIFASIVSLYKGRWPGDHMQNFFESVADRTEPISDVASHVVAMNACHSCNIALFLGRELQWNAQQQRFDGDEQANAFLARRRRAEYSLEHTT